MNYITAGLRVIYDRTSDYVNYMLDTSGGNITNENSSSQTQNLYRNNIRKRIFDTIPMITQFKTFLCHPTYIIDNIYLGSAYNASNYELLKSYNIKYIINITNEISNHFPDDFVYFNFKILDNNKDRLFDFLEESLKLIKEYQKNNDGSILIHCFMGASRSATVVAHYLIKEHDLTPDLAIVFLKEKRITVNLTNRLYNDLCEKYEKDKLLLQ
jgi:protein phosphatase slingshot